MTKKDQLKLGFIVGFILLLAIFRVVFNDYSDKQLAASKTQLELQPTNYNFSNVLSAQDKKQIDLPTAGLNGITHP